MSGLATSTKTVNATGSIFVDSLFVGTAWAGSTITYAFPTSATSYSYSGYKENAFNAVSVAQKNAALFAMESSFGSPANDGFSVEGFTNLKFAVGNVNNATIRFAESSTPDTAEVADFPGNLNTFDTADDGDIWFGTGYAGTTLDLRKPVAGNYAWHTLIHELGHALGLKHAQEDLVYGAMPYEWNSIEYTVMSYRSFVGDFGSGYDYEQFGGPQTFMMADIAALQAMYGADYTTNSGATVYKWNPGSGDTLVNGKVAIDAGANRIFATIWDGGGVDTYDLTAYTKGVTIDLRPGGYSNFDAVQRAYLGGGPNDGFARGNIFNALLFNGDLRSIIENAKGGKGSDYILGNEAANKLFGNSGNDTLDGSTGNDTLVGGAGADKLIGGSGTDTASYAEAKGAVGVSLWNPKSNTGEATGDTFSSIERLTGSRFSDRLEGNTAANLLNGGAGNDRIYGGSGADTLYGGTGADTFIFKKIAESNLAARDMIYDFSRSQGDKIHLSAIDASTKVSGDQAFIFIGEKAFTDKAGQLRYANANGDTYLYGDVNGDGKTDFSVRFDKTIEFVKGDFIL